MATYQRAKHLTESDRNKFDLQFCIPRSFRYKLFQLTLVLIFHCSSCREPADISHGLHLCPVYGGSEPDLF